ncbi:MAG: hypothetical protein ABJB05_07950 [Parafilimonas sp.]
MTALNIVPECYVDTRLAEILAQSSKQIFHQKGHGQVANKMLFKLKDQFALGIIDKDTIKVRKSRYFSEFNDIRKENSLILQKHFKLSHYLIIIDPAIEKWLLQNAEVSNIAPDNLGNNLKDLLSFTKRQHIHRNIYFTEFIIKLINNHAPGIITLKTWIEKFLANDELI